MLPKLETAIWFGWDITIIVLARNCAIGHGNAAMARNRELVSHSCFSPSPSFSRSCLLSLSCFLLLSLVLLLSCFPALSLIFNWLWFPKGQWFGGGLVILYFVLLMNGWDLSWSLSSIKLIFIYILFHFVEEIIVDLHCHFISFLLHFIYISSTYHLFFIWVSRKSERAGIWRKPYHPLF